VDYVGLNLYVAGATNGRATVSEMVEMMIPQMDSVAEYYSSIGVNHLTITEAGASIMDGGSVLPWRVQFPAGTPVDYQEQADYYAAFYQALQRSKLGALVTGVTFWAWEVVADDADPAAHRLSIAGNPLVQQVLAEQWGGNAPQ
jgi:catechol-2,3-dioxygenase